MARLSALIPSIRGEKIEMKPEAMHWIWTYPLQAIRYGMRMVTIYDYENGLRYSQLGARVKETTIDKIHQLGIQLECVNIKDILFPGPLKVLFAEVMKAKKEGFAALKKARGETAALRNLANAAQMVQLWALQSSSGNTVVVGMASQVG